MADSESGLDVMRSRIQRASRKAPPPRGATQASAPVPPAPVSAPPTESATEPSDRAEKPKKAAQRRLGTPGNKLAPDTPSVNLAIRVRRPLDDRLVELIHDLRRGGVRTSKVELVEMLLWELPEDSSAALRQRLSAFRAAAPRVGSADTEI